MRPEGISRGVAVVTQLYRARQELLDNQLWHAVYSVKMTRGCFGGCTKHKSFSEGIFSNVFCTQVDGLVTGSTRVLQHSLEADDNRSLLRVLATVDVTTAVPPPS